MSILDKFRAEIAAHRDALLLRSVARASESFLHAYRNQLNWDFRVNGEAHALREITRVVPGAVFDVGANLGRWAAMAAEVVGDKRIHCFEVIPANFLRMSRRLGDRRNIILNSFGLGAEAKSIDVYYYPDSSDRSSAYYLDDGFKKEIVRAAVIRGDDYVREKGVTQISFLKIDVEGMEMDVLEGFESSLRAGIVKAVQFEHGPAHLISRHFLKDFVDFFGRFSFGVFSCYPNALRALSHDLAAHESFIGQNYVALSPDARMAIHSATDLIQRSAE